MTSKNDYEPVLLMEPILVGESKHKSHVPSPKDCTIGGTPHYYTLKDRSNPKCAICNHDMFLLAQIYAPLLEVGLERTLYVISMIKFLSNVCNIFTQCIQNLHLSDFLLT